MSLDGRIDAPPYILPVSDKDNKVRTYETHQFHVSVGGKNNEINGNHPPTPIPPLENYPTKGIKTTCSSCQQEVLTNVTYKAGRYAWLMCLLFICLGLVLCCCLIPFFLNRFKDKHHTCPRCNRVLLVEKRKCCK